MVFYQIYLDLTNYEFIYPPTHTHTTDRMWHTVILAE